MLNLNSLPQNNSSESLIAVDTEIPVSSNQPTLDPPTKKTQSSDGFFSNLSKVFKLAFSSIDDI
ncbi:MAG: hypothetical protein VKJ02_16395 [Snowella sp.]|nr:hypothetical protein [Snowella sp.]